MPEDDSTAKVLITNLRSFLPPSLRELANILAGSQDYPEFAAIVREILPERELEILGQPSSGQQIATFASYFEDRYFPLHGSLTWVEWAEDMSYWDFVRGMPIVTCSFSYYDYHELPGEQRAAEKLLAYLVEAPFGETNARIPLGESCLEHISMDMLEKIPKEGFKTDDLAEWLSGTQYEGLVAWAKIVGHESNNDFIDIDDEDLYSGWELPQWSLANVEYLTREWHQAQVIWRSANELLLEVEKEPAKKFEEILDFILKRQAHPPKKKGKCLFDIFTETTEEGSFENVQNL